MHKSGFVNIIGNPNVGKSTLMNALVGEKLSIITSKAQTTRHRIMGIVSSEDFQIVYSDTPGILKPSYKLQESMMKFVTGAVADADVILYVTDTVERGERSAEIIDRIRQSGVPAIVVINKIDRPDQRIHEVIDEVLELLMDLNATDEQLDSPMLFCSGRQGTASYSPDVPGKDLRPLFETILELSLIHI